MRILDALALGLLAAMVWSAHGEFSNSLELESVTTFDTCEDAFPGGVSNDTFANLACSGNNTKAMTAIRYIVAPGENDVAAGRSLVFYSYPPPFGTQPINQDVAGDGAPPNNPCSYANSGTNCSSFVGTNTTYGPITLEVRASSAVRKYFLRPILESERVPYTYTDHNLKVPRCGSTASKQTWPTCDNNCDSVGGECPPFNQGNIRLSGLACCRYLDDYSVLPCKDGQYPGSIYTPSQAYSQFTGTCGDQDSYLLLADGNTDVDPDGDGLPDPGACRACHASYGITTRPEACQAAGNNEPVSNKCPLPGAPCHINVATDSGITPVFHPTLCPVGVGHVGNYPATTSDLHSGRYGATDAYSLEPYYYWCQSQCVGLGSYTSKDVYGAHQTQGNCAIGAFALQEDGSGGLRQDTELANVGGEKQNNYNQYLNAYLCSMDYDWCPERQFAHSVDGAGLPCCNSTFITDPESKGTPGTFQSTCADPDKDQKDVESQGNCGGIAAEQVQNAAAYLTAVCDATDSGESLCGHDCQSNYDTNAPYPPSGTNPPLQQRAPPGYNTPFNHGWQCPGWPYDHLRPAINIDQHIHMAKCSAECETDPYIRWQIDTNENDCTKSADCTTVLEQVTSERAIVSMGPGSCRVYEVVPEPILDIVIQIVVTGADGTTYPSVLSTAQGGASIATVNVNGATFTHRINQDFVRGGAGPQIPGLIVVCGTDADAQNDPKTLCCTSPTTSDVGGGPASCSQSESYNPYDPDDTDNADISVPKPTAPSSSTADNDFCQTGQHIGGIRSVFPGGTLFGGELVTGEIPQINPWPQLIRKMMQARELNTYTRHIFDGETTAFVDEDISAEAQACHVPSHRYLGVLNCGKAVSWYYVPEERKEGYGLDCGKVGVQNYYPTYEAGRRTMCMQGDGSCTPGYGKPKFTSGGTPFYRTPCQEIGDMVKTTAAAVDEHGNAVPCTGQTPAAFDMPGFHYLNSDERQTASSTAAVMNVPNTWVHGLQGSMFLYQQITTEEQQDILLDVQTYTDTFFGDSVQTYTDGILVPGPQNLTICLATLNEQPGIFEVGVVNTNAAHGGSYLVTAVCFDDATSTGLAATTPNATEGTPEFITGQAIQADVGPGGTKYVSWDITVVGAVPSPTPTPETNIGVPSCTATLYHNGGDYAKLATLNVNCNAIVASTLTPSRLTSLDETIVKVASCKGYQFFCWLSRQGPIETGMIVILVVLVGFFGIIFFACQLRLVRVTAKSRTDMTALTHEVRQLEAAREKGQASLVLRGISKKGSPQ